MAEIRRQLAQRGEHEAPLVQQVDGPLQHLLAVAQVGTERKVDDLHGSSSSGPERGLRAAAQTRLHAEVVERPIGRYAAARGAVEEAELDQVRLVDLFNRV